MARRKFSTSEILQVLINQGVVILCFRCQEPIEKGEDAEKEHIHEIALGGADEVSNCVFSHWHCHDTITNGTKATTAGSSKHRIKKAERIAAGGRKRKGPKMKSKPFPDIHRPMQSRKFSHGQDK